MMQNLSILRLAAGLGGSLASPLSAAPALHSYTAFKMYEIPDVSEASAVEYNRDTDTLFSIGDEGNTLFQLSKTGQFIDLMSFDNSGERAGRTLDDSEGIAYMGNGKFMIADERRNVGWVTSYSPNTTVGKGVMTGYTFGPYDSNTGLEGVAYDPLTNSMWGIKEQNPLMIYQMTNMASDGSCVVTNPFSGNRFSRAGIMSMSDIHLLSESRAFAADDPRRMNILILARNDRKILEMTRTGDVVDTLDISPLGRTTIEGLTMDDDGVIYLVAEQTVSLQDKPALYVLTSPVPAFTIREHHITQVENSVQGQLTWDSTAGKSYRIEYSSDLNEWQEVSSTYVAGGATTTGTTSPVTAAVSGTGFFRVKEVAAS